MCRYQCLRIFKQPLSRPFEQLQGFYNDLRISINNLFQEKAIRRHIWSRESPISSMQNFFHEMRCHSSSSYLYESTHDVPRHMPEETICFHSYLYEVAFNACSHKVYFIKFFYLQREDFPDRVSDIAAGSLKGRKVMFSYEILDCIDHGLNFEDLFDFPGISVQEC